MLERYEAALNHLDRTHFILATGIMIWYSRTSITPFSLTIMHQWVGSALIRFPSLCKTDDKEVRAISSLARALMLDSPYSISSSSSIVLLHTNTEKHIHLTSINWILNLFKNYCNIGVIFKTARVLRAVVVIGCYSQQEDDVNSYLMSWMMVSASDWSIIVSSLMEQLTLFSVVNMPLTSR